jgi:hypothetical protein
VSASADQIRVGIANAIKAIDGIQASPYALSNPTPPTAHVLRGAILYDQAMDGGTHIWTMRVQAYVGLVSDLGAQMLLDKYLSADGNTSIKAAIEADRTLGGIVQDLHVTDATGEQQYDRASGGPVLGSEWTVQVWL